MERRNHDLGGLPGGPIDWDPHEAEPWHKLITAMVGAARARGLMTIDEMRRAMEDLPAEDYNRPYFERWVEGAIDLLEEKGVLSRAEVEQRMAAARDRLEG